MSALLKSSPDDFIVREQLKFNPDEEGQHLLLNIQKVGLNTKDVITKLAQFYAVRVRDIGYCGLKDKNAVTSQWFSVDLAGRAVMDFSNFSDDNISILALKRHKKKLRIGVHAGNQFSLVLREVNGGREEIERRLTALATQGMPNYFAEQRFGRHNRNLELALDMVKHNKRGKGFLYSVLRSYLFNLILQRRVELANWNKIIAGDVMMFADNNSMFYADDNNDTRLATLELHPSAPLWGKGGFGAKDEAREIENEVLSGFSEIKNFLEKTNQMHRRALRCKIDNLQWQWLDNTKLQLEFFLRPGSYATAVVNELCTTADS